MRVDQHRQAPAVVDVRVAEHDGIDAVDVEGEGVEVAPLVLVAALDHAAIEQQPFAGGFDLVQGTGDLTGWAVKENAHERILLVRTMRTPSPKSRSQARGRPAFAGLRVHSIEQDA